MLLQHLEHPQRSYQCVGRVGTKDDQCTSTNCYEAWLTWTGVTQCNVNNRSLVGKSLINRATFNQTLFTKISLIFLTLDEFLPNFLPPNRFLCQLTKLQSHQSFIIYSICHRFLCIATSYLLDNLTYKHCANVLDVIKHLTLGSKTLTIR